MTPRGLQLLPDGLDVVDMQRDMMQPRPALTEESAYDRFRTERLQQLHAALAQRNHRRPHAFMLHRLFMQHAQPERLVEPARRGDALDRDAKVVDPCTDDGSYAVLMRGCLR